MKVERYRFPVVPFQGCVLRQWKCMYVYVKILVCMLVLSHEKQRMIVS